MASIVTLTALSGLLVTVTGCDDNDEPIDINDVITDTSDSAEGDAAADTEPADYPCKDVDYQASHQQPCTPGVDSVCYFERRDCEHNSGIEGLETCICRRSGVDDTRGSWYCQIGGC